VDSPAGILARILPGGKDHGTCGAASRNVAEAGDGERGGTLGGFVARIESG